MLTGQRREEVAGMTWARELLRALPSNRPGDIQGAHQRAKLALVFPCERGTAFSGWSKAKSSLDIASGVSGWWLHDLRRTLATGLQRLGVRLEGKRRSGAIFPATA
jgi:hypothetical protein